MPKMIRELTEEQEKLMEAYNLGYIKGYDAAKAKFQLGPWEKVIGVTDRMGGAFDEYDNRDFGWK